MLVHYQTELGNFKRNLGMLKSEGANFPVKNYTELMPAKVDLLNQGIELFPIQKGQRIYSDQETMIEDFAGELKNMKGLRFSDEIQQEQGTIVRFKCEDPVKILVGYFNTNSYSVLRPPTLETNAQANNRGQADIKIANALKLDGLYPVNIYTYKFEAGENELKLGKGRVLILGFFDGNKSIQIHDAGLTDANDGIPVDWLFY